jgi:7-keto-8-aminopelargonate synthetase-like enzyme
VVVIKGAKVLMFGSNSYLGSPIIPKSNTVQRRRAKIRIRLCGFTLSRRYPGHSPGARKHAGRTGSHGIGVMGTGGAGSADHFGLTDRVHIVMGTFSKSLASVGGFIAADTVTIEYLKHTARSLIFSASISPANTAAVLAALKIMRREPERIERLWQNTHHMQEGLRRLGFETGTGGAPIIVDFFLAFYRR